VTRQSPEPAALPSVALLGMGRAGRGVVRLLAAAGVPVPWLWNRSGGLDRLDGRAVIHGAIPDADVDAVILAVPDRAIADLAARVRPTLASHTALLHLSGATPPGVLRSPDDPRDCGSMHPLQTFPADGAPRTPFPWVLAGDERAVQVARRLVDAMGCPHVGLPDGDRARYHAAASIASNLLVALVAVVERQAVAAGLPPGEARALFGPLMRTTLDGALDHGCGAALTGPVVRGDRTTVRAHLEALADAPEDRAVYARLSLQLLDLARKRGLSEADAAALRSQLENAVNCQHEDRD